MHLHVVSFDVPYPADYGGVIDVYNRLVVLSKAGFKLHLHCYTYGREEAVQLSEICQEVNYYPRETGWRHQFDIRPYIVASRCAKALLARLREDDYPILLEGLHDCWVLEQLGDTGRKIFVRTHNVEHDYYHSLAQAEPMGWKRIFFQLESIKLRRYERVLLKASAVLAISENDATHFRSMGCHVVHLLPPSHGHSRVVTQLGRGNYVLYHGNLSVPENQHAVEYLLDNVLKDLPCQFVVAGRNPSNELKERIARYNFVRLVENPSDEQMRTFLRDAQVNVLYTEQATGVKLKLLNALYEGRYCLVNRAMVAGTNLAQACHVADTPALMREALTQLMARDFTAEELIHRQDILAYHRDIPTDILDLFS